TQRDDTRACAHGGRIPRGDDRRRSVRGSGDPGAFEALSRGGTMRARGRGIHNHRTRWSIVCPRFSAARGKWKEGSYGGDASNSRWPARALRRAKMKRVTEIL